MGPYPGASVPLERDPLLTDVCDLPLTRAILIHRGHEDASLPGGRTEDLGLGVILDGRSPARAEILDLGSAEVRTGGLEGPLVILGWVYTSTLKALRAGLETGREELRQSTFPLALEAIRRAGFGPLTRPLVLRLGFRDLTRDLDLHESTAVRLIVPGGRVVRIHLEYDTTTLVARTGSGARDPKLECAFRDAFAAEDVAAGACLEAGGIHCYRIPFPAPSGLEETRRFMGRLRSGFLHLFARFESDRYRAVRDQLQAFGARDSLAPLAGIRESRGRRGLGPDRIGPAPDRIPADGRVH